MKEDSLQGGEHTAHNGKLQGVIARDQGQETNYQLTSKLLGGTKFHLTVTSDLVHMTFLLAQTASKARRMLSL
jgi:hypothetical protein